MLFSSHIESENSAHLKKINIFYLLEKINCILRLLNILGRIKMNYDAFIKKIEISLPEWLNKMETQPLKYKMCANAFDLYCLDAITLAYDIRQMINMGLNEYQKDAAKKILDEYQANDNGFFLEQNQQKKLENVKIDRVTEMHSNYITFQTIGAYKAINRKPNNKISFYDQFIYNKGISDYLYNNCPWKISPWGAGGMVDNLGTILSMNITLGSTEYISVIDTIFEWLNKNQSDETGLWGSTEVQGINGIINGGYHLMRGTFFTFDKPFYKADKIIDSILFDLDHHEKFKTGEAFGCQDIDHFFLLEKCSARLKDYRRKEIMAACEKRIKQLIETISCDDGGFSFEARNAVKKHNYIDVSPGNKESDMLGTLFYLQTFISIFNIINQSNPFNSSKTHG
jgi:hypothetical protein